MAAELNTTRRRFLAVAAAAPVFLSTGQAVQAAQQVTWRGVAMGAQAQIRLVHYDPSAARGVLEECVAEIDRLENLFSLYRERSALCRLNRTGQLNGPAQEFVELLATSIDLSRQTEGAFDISIQPLWQVYEHYYAKPAQTRSGTGPDADAISRARHLIGYRNIFVSPQKIALGKGGMSLTLNGIAQGFITDKITSLLNARGFRDVLVDMGEIFGSGTKQNGAPWIARLPASAEAAAREKYVKLLNRAVATSSRAGFQFSETAAHHHIFDPLSGQNANLYRSVSVVAANATLADGLSTAFSALPIDRISKISAHYPEADVFITANDGTRVTL